MRASSSSVTTATGHSCPIGLKYIRRAASFISHSNHSGLNPDRVLNLGMACLDKQLLDKAPYPGKVCANLKKIPGKLWRLKIKNRSLERF